MTITTKFKAGQKVYLLYKNNILFVEIEEIRVYINEDLTIINYSINSKSIGAAYPKLFTEHELFATKKELLNSL